MNSSTLIAPTTAVSPRLRSSGTGRARTLSGERIRMKVGFTPVVRTRTAPSPQVQIKDQPDTGNGGRPPASTDSTGTSTGTGTDGVKR